MDTAPPFTESKPLQSFADTLEALQKWLSIAYGLGFLTVMLNTVSLGIPALELAEPVQIWVGIPLDFVFWLVIAAYRYFRRSSRLIDQDARMMQEQYYEAMRLAEEGKAEAAFTTLYKTILRYLVPLIPIPFFSLSWLAAPVGRISATALEKMNRKSSNNPLTSIDVNGP